LIVPGEEPKLCETMNGNCVLVTREAAQRTGNFSSEFTHGIGDFDYGLRARAAGCTIWVVPGFVGTCDGNSSAQLWGGGSGSLGHRWQRLNNPKGLPFWEYGRYARKHGGPIWPIFWLLPYLRFFAGILRLRRESASAQVANEPHPSIERKTV
jgi:GT2 family glycosyltransferase